MSAAYKPGDRLFIGGDSRLKVEVRQVMVTAVYRNGAGEWQYDLIGWRGNDRLTMRERDLKTRAANWLLPVVPIKWKIIRMETVA